MLQKMKNKRGLTLFCIIDTIAVFGLLAMAVAIPSLKPKLRQKIFRMLHFEE